MAITVSIILLIQKSVIRSESVIIQSNSGCNHSISYMFQDLKQSERISGKKDQEKHVISSLNDVALLTNHFHSLLSVLGSLQAFRVSILIPLIFYATVNQRNTTKTLLCRKRR